MTERPLSAFRRFWLSAFACIALSIPALANDTAFIGLSLRDIASGDTVVAWIHPGPLGGNGLASDTHDIARPDLVVSVDGQAMNAEEFKGYIEAKSPGDHVTITYRKSNARGGTIPNAINHEEEVREITVTLASQDAWTGTIGQPRLIDHVWEPGDEPPLLDPHDPANILGAAIAEHDLEEPLAKLLAAFEKYDREVTDTHMLPLVRAGFQWPFQLGEVGDALVVSNSLSSDEAVVRALTVAAEALSLEARTDEIAGGGSGPGHVLGMIGRNALGQMKRTHGLALAQFDGSAQHAAACLDFLRVPRRTFYINGADSQDDVAVIRSSLDVDAQQLLEAFGYCRYFVEEPWDWVETMGRAGPRPGLTGVTGQIKGAQKDEQLGWIVLGSMEDNRYDMSKIAVVIDPGGNDEYYASDLRIGNRIIIDLEGNDTYTGTDDQGPGGALFGVSLIDDRAGDDRYEGKMLSCGAACFGVSLLLDRAGSDTYIGSDWSLGAAVYGAGMLFDLGDGDDTYIGEFLCQGVGGPRGFGCIIDEAGDDSYNANGPQPSMYGTEGVYASFSQGVGFGYRNYAAGGIGMIADLAGNDRYESGEFSQGGAYYYALGILRDYGGDDEYIGNRYGQGFGVHQAHGMLIDDAGDDSYWSMTAASQGAAWDIGAGLLLDRAGNDRYECDGLGQGGAAQQGIAMLVDLDGIDEYISRNNSRVQGESGGNDYHWLETGAFSFSLLLDLGGDEDVYSTGRPNNAVTKTGAINEGDPARSNAWGLLIDR